MINRLTIIIVLAFNYSYSQKLISDNTSILVNPKDSLLAYYSVSKDSLCTSLSLYINGYESKQKREKIISQYQKNVKGKRDSYLRLPTFSVNFLSMTKPEKIYSLDSLNYITTKEFNNYDTIPIPSYFIIPQKDGTYLRWRAVAVVSE